MRKRLLIISLITAILLILAVPLTAAAQDDRYNRSQWDRSQWQDRYDRYDRTDRRDLRYVLQRLDNDSARLQGDMNDRFNRRVLGFVVLRDNDAIARARDFRRAVRDLRMNSNNGRDLYRSRDEARLLLDSGANLDRFVRRAGDNRLDADMTDIRRDLQIIADAYGLSRPY
jgi:hypothetical protein